MTVSLAGREFLPYSLRESPSRDAECFGSMQALARIIDGHAEVRGLTPFPALHVVSVPVRTAGLSQQRMRDCSRNAA